MQSAPEDYWIPGARPEIWTWYLVYAIGMAVMYGFVALLGVAYLAGAGFLPAVSPSDQLVFGIYGVLCLVMGIGFGVAFGVAPFLPKKPWAWVYHLVLICLGLTSCCCMPVCIPLLIQWLKPETKAMFAEREG